MNSPAQENNSEIGKKVESFLAFGEIDKKTLEELIEKRGQAIDKQKKVDVKKALEEMEKAMALEKANLKPFFRLHPPRGGAKTKFHFAEGGILGNHREKINLLVRKML